MRRVGRFLAVPMFLGVAALNRTSAAQAPPQTPQGGAPGVTPNAPPPMTATIPSAPPLPSRQQSRPGLAPVAPGQVSSLPGSGTSGGGGLPPAAAGRKGQPPMPPTFQAPNTAPESNLGTGLELTPVTRGGLTAQQVGERAAATSFQAKAADALRAGADKRVEQQRIAFLPRLGLTGRYSRLSNFTPPQITDGFAVETDAPAGTVNPAQTVSVAQTRFPLVLNQFLMQATIAVPISDYFVKIKKVYDAAKASVDAAQYDVQAARAKSCADGQIAFFTWLRAKGSIVIATQSLAVARSHQKDAEIQLQAGSIFAVDVLRAQTQVAAAELGVDRAKSGHELTDVQLRLAVHAADGEALEAGESLEESLAPLEGSLKQLVTEALTERVELKSVAKNAEATRKLAEATRSGKVPVLSAFGDTTYANPNPRVFPQTSRFFPTWAVGAQVTWSPSDYLSAGAGAGDIDARAASIEAQYTTLKESITIEVTQAYEAIVEADAAIRTTQRELESAAEGYRVARQLFIAGRTTSTSLIDAEVILAQTRFEHLNALVDARLGRVRLEYATGRLQGIKARTAR